VALKLACQNGAMASGLAAPNGQSWETMTPAGNLQSLDNIQRSILAELLAKTSSHRIREVSLNKWRASKLVLPDTPHILTDRYETSSSVAAACLCWQTRSQTPTTNRSL